MRTDIRRPTNDAGFRHDALFYADTQGFVTGVSAFIRDSVAEREPILVVVGAEKIELLRRELGGDPEGVRFADMLQLGRNPARIIPAWRDFVSEHAASGRRFRGIGEPIWATRSASELVECARHEALLNLAFAGGLTWWLVCPYDAGSLPASVLDEAERNHPWVTRDGEGRGSETYRGIEDVARPFDDPLPEPAADVPAHRFGGDGETLSALRLRVTGSAGALGLDPARTDDLVLIVNEVATNSVRHGGGTGTLRIWGEGPSVICEIRDGGRILDPLVGRRKPPGDRGSGLGLWLANQLCDLVQIRSFPTGTAVRLHVRR
jgi:anti-sigma regulatory factor (Ser/Thr protein kinase)